LSVALRCRRFKLSLKAKPENLALVRRVIKNFVLHSQFEARLYDIQLVLTEAFTNVVRHAYKGIRKERLITVEGIINDRRLILVVQDAGKGLTAKPVRACTLGGGYGLFLIEELSDNFYCRSLPGRGTTIRVTFYRSSWSKISWRRAVIPLVASFLLIFSVYFTYLSLNSLPLGTFYPYRLKLEQLGLVLSFSTPDKTELALTLVGRHLKDAKYLLKQNKYKASAASVDQLSRYIVFIESLTGKLDHGGQARLMVKVEEIYGEITKLKKILRQRNNNLIKNVGVRDQIKNVFLALEVTSLRLENILRNLRSQLSIDYKLL
jgi:anti-sigma regulatory factor (Ser/Thr protein kinase)